MKQDETLEPQKLRMLMTLRGSGIHDLATLRAIERIPREHFTPAVMRDQAYENRTLPLACGQTLSAPDVVALMTQSLALKPTSRVLEIGTGSGYQAAVLAQIVERVFTIERWRHLALAATKSLHDLGLNNVLCAHGDGYKGWPAEAPFEAILIAAGCREVPSTLFSQLPVGGRLVAPVGSRGQQNLTLYERHQQGFSQTILAPAQFVPLRTGVDS